MYLTAPKPNFRIAIALQILIYLSAIKYAPDIIFQSHSFKVTL